jgi:hypothetical protein
VELTIFLCDPEAAYIRQLSDDMDRQELERDREADVEHERELAAEFLDPEAGEDDWPWYADLPYEICEPQVFTP